MPNEGGRYEVRDGEPVLVERTDGPQPSANPKPKKTRAPSAPAEVAPTTEEDTDDADA